jgi:hypothetical protein
MTEARSSERTSYHEARSAFEKLETQDKVAFVVEATFTTLGRAIEHAGRTFSVVLDDLAASAARAFEEAEDQPEESTPPPAAGPDRGSEPFHGETT